MELEWFTKSVDNGDIRHGRGYQTLRSGCSTQVAVYRRIIHAINEHDARVLIHLASVDFRGLPQNGGG